MKKPINILNKKARYNYQILDTYMSGICLIEGEISSLRSGTGSITDAYCLFKNHELWLVNSYIKPWFTGWINPKERRDRKLLLTRKELNKLEKAVQTPGYSIIPLKMFTTDKRLCKVEIALCKGKKEYDKRETIKDEDNKRNLDRVMKIYR